MIFTERDYMEFCGFTYAFPYIPLQKMKHDTSFVKDPRILPLIHSLHMYVINFYWFCEDEASPSNVSTIQTLTVSLIKKCLAQTSRAEFFSLCFPWHLCSVLLLWHTCCVTPQNANCLEKEKAGAVKKHRTAEKCWGFPNYLFLLLMVKTYQVMVVSLMKTMAKSQTLTVALNQAIWWENS